MRVKLAALTIAIASMLFGLSPSAKADTFQYDFTDTISTTNIVFTITEPTLQPSGDVTSFTSVTSSLAGTITEFVWNSAAGDCLGSNVPGVGCASFENSVVGPITFFFAAGSFLSPGSYTSLNGGTTLDITDLSTVGTPEPSSLLLLGCGLFGLLAIAKFRLRRIGAQ